MRQRARRAYVAVSAVTVLALGACGTTVPEETRTAAAQSEEQVEDEPVTSTPRAIRDAFSLLKFDYEPQSAEQTAAESDLVITGTLVSVEPGRSESAPEDGLSPMRYSALQIQVDEVVQGTGVAAGDALWLEIGSLVAPLEESLTEGLRMSAFLVRAPGSEDGSVDWGSIPDGESTWWLAHPEGLTFQYGAEQGTIPPLGDGQADREATLDDSLPGT